MTRALWGSGLVAVLGLVLSCGDRCVAGESQPCGCADGRLGAQLCRSSGTFDRCLCTGGPAGTGGGGFPGVGGGAPSLNRAPELELKHAAWSALIGQELLLDVGARDPDGDVLAFEWRVTARPPGSNAGFALPGLATQRFTPDALGAYQVEVQVTDGALSATAVLEVEALNGASLPFSIVDAALDAARDRLVVLSLSPARLLVYDLQTRTSASVDLARVPTALSLTPDGATAVVGHDGQVSVVALVGAPVVQHVWPVPLDVLDVVASATHAYLFPRRDQWEAITWVELETGVTAATSDWSIYAGTVGTWHPGGTRLYGAGTSNDIQRYDLTGGAITSVRSPPSQGLDRRVCGGVWIARDGAQLLTACGTLLRCRATFEDDMVYAGTVPGGYFRGMAEAPDGRRWAALAVRDRYQTTERTELWTVDVVSLTSPRSTRLPAATAPGTRLEARFVFVDGRDQVHVLLRVEEPAAVEASLWLTLPL